MRSCTSDWSMPIWSCANGLPSTGVPTTSPVNEPSLDSTSRTSCAAACADQARQATRAVAIAVLCIKVSLVDAGAGPLAGRARIIAARSVPPTGRKSFLADGLHVRGHFALQQAQRHGAGEQHAVVESARVEALAERVAGLVAQPDHFELADLVRGRLAGHDHVAVDFRGRDAVVD